MSPYLAAVLIAATLGPSAVKGCVDAYRIRQSAVTARAAAKAREGGR